VKKTEARRRRRWPRILGSTLTALLLVGAVLVTAIPTWGQKLESWRTHYEVTRASYEAKYGLWKQLAIPGKYQINGIHSTEIHSSAPGFSDAIVIMAGSGNDEDFFNAGSFRTIVINPITGQIKEIPTPWDAFCAGHVQLPDGNILVAGGTERYEDLNPVRAGGAMTVINTSMEPVTLPKGTIFVGPRGVQVRTAFDLSIAPARRLTSPQGNEYTVNGARNIWVDADKTGKAGVVKQSARWRLVTPGNIVYGQGTPITLQKQDFQGTNDAYIIDVNALKYVKVNSMDYARWYPTLTEMGNGMDMANSGLDNTGQVAQQSEWFNPATRTWTDGPVRGLPTYPALFLTKDGRLMYTGSNAGYGPTSPSWRSPGLWNVANNTLQPIDGMPDQSMLETSASVLLPPAQSQRFMVLGGGGVGQSNKSTARTAIIDLNQSNPHWMRGPNMARPTRYPITAILPTWPYQVLVTGGSQYYRGMHGSDNRDTRIYNVATNTFSWAANSITGRDYHSGGIVMTDGTVVTLGGNPLFGDAADTTPQTFNHEIDVYLPPYLFTHTPRPVIQGVPSVEQTGRSYVMFASQGADIKSLQLMKPNNPTHVTDVNLRDIAVPFKFLGGTAFRFTIPGNHNIVPPGWYKLYAVNSRGVPSVAAWVRIL